MAASLFSEDSSALLLRLILIIHSLWHVRAIPRLLSAQ